MGAVARSGWYAGFALALAACGGPAAPPAPPTAATPAPPAAASVPPDKSGETTVELPPAPGAVAAATAVAALVPTAPKYEAAGRRDPFESLESRLGSDRSTVATAKLTGVIHGEGDDLALVETSDGIGYILKPGDTLADGRLIEVGPRTAVFSIAPRPGSTANRVVLKLASD
jgi:hypothetical protein